MHGESNRRDRFLGKLGDRLQSSRHPLTVRDFPNQCCCKVAKLLSLSVESNNIIRQLFRSRNSRNHRFAFLFSRILFLQWIRECGCFAVDSWSSKTVVTRRAELGINRISAFCSIRAVICLGDFTVQAIVPYCWAKRFGIADQKSP